MDNIICDGYWDSYGIKYDVNLSSIWDHIIGEVGKLCECYRGDVIYDINTIENYVSKSLGDSQEVKIFWIGIRGSGVDHEDFIKHRCKDEYYYRGVYKIIVEKKVNKCIVTLVKSSSWDFRKEHDINV